MSVSDSKGCHKPSKSNSIFHDVQMSMVPIKFCFVFPLRLGVMVIAVTEMALAGFAILILALCAERAEEIFMEAFADSAEDGNAVSPVSRWQFFYNNPHMQKGLQLGTFMLFLLYVALVLTTTHLLTCILLLYGAVKGISKFLLPWLTMVITGIVLSSLAIVAFFFLPYDGCKEKVLCISLLGVFIEFHSWLIVYGYYQHAKAKARARIASNLLFAHEYEWGAENPHDTPILSH